MSQTALPDNLIPEASRLLLPHVGTVEERDTWLTQAFYTTERRLYHQIAREGAPVVFTTRCIRTLLDFGCLPSGKHSLSALLDALRLAYGAQERDEITNLAQQLDALCSKQEAAHCAPHDTIALPKVPVQTIHTPAHQRTPTVFVSYAHTDKGFVDRLIADLQAAGHACWIDTTDIKGGDEWTRAITEGINNSYAFLTIVSEAGNASRWVRREFLWAEDKQKAIFPVLVEECGLPIYMIDLQYTPLHEDYAAGLQDLLRALPAPIIAQPDDALVIEEPVRSANQRAQELEYLDYLRLNELLHTEKYTPLAGTAHVHEASAPYSGWVEPVVIRPEFAHLRQRENDEQPQTIVTRKFEDIIGAVEEIRRVVILGEPGAGKTTTLWKLARNLVDGALDNPAAPIPVLVRLGRWTDADQPLATFIAAEMGELGAHLDTLIHQARAVLLLDGLNELPVAQRETKAKQVQRLVNVYPALAAVVTCREQDYTFDLGLDRIEITPLDPLRIREFMNHYLGAEQGEALFWRLAGDEAQLYEELFRAKFSERMADWDRVFWLDNRLPQGFMLNEYYRYGQRSWDRWLEIREHPGSLMTLARNPYMLLMMTDVFARDGNLPENRGELFARFVDTLLVREHITEGAEALLTALGTLAYEMQVQRGETHDGNTVTALPRDAVGHFLDKGQLYQANSASILSVDDGVRFTHQLLQEYFAATHMRGEIEAGLLRAGSIWPSGGWWRRTNWEEAAILLAGLYSNDCTPVVEWVAEANPEVAAVCIQRSGAYTPTETLEHCRAAWIPRLTDLERDPEPEARAAVGRALGMLDLDNRPGVGLRPDGLPDIDWVEIPAGEFLMGSEIEIDPQAYYDETPQRRVELPSFFISRYPVTFKQFQAFVDAPDGFHNPAWWDDAVLTSTGNQVAPAEQTFRFWNHPRERVSWFEAIAFCRWLSSKLAFEVTLPSEAQWEKAARGDDGRRYPHGDEFDINKGNVRETGIGQTSAVGIFPDGASPYGVVDMCANVFEWCSDFWLSSYGEIHDERPARVEKRVLRGGAWEYDARLARCSYRSSYYPDYRLNLIGFRVICTHPSY